MIRMKENYSKTGQNSFNIYKILNKKDIILQNKNNDKNIAIEKIEKKYNNFKMMFNRNIKNKSKFKIFKKNKKVKPAFGILTGREKKNLQWFENNSNRNYNPNYNFYYPKIQCKVKYLKKKKEIKVNSQDKKVILPDNKLCNNIISNKSTVNMNKMNGRAYYNNLNFKSESVNSRSHNYNFTKQIKVPNFDNYSYRKVFNNIDNKIIKDLNYEPSFNILDKKITKNIYFKNKIINNLKSKKYSIMCNIEPKIFKDIKKVPLFNKILGRNTLIKFNR